MCAPCSVGASQRHGPPCFGGLHGLASDDGGAGLSLVAHSAPDSAAAQGMPHLPGAVLPPAPAVLVDHRPGRKVMGPQTPRAAATENREEGIADVARRIVLGASSRVGGRPIGGNQRPFRVREVGRVRCAGFHRPEDNPVDCATARLLNTLSVVGGGTAPQTDAGPAQHGRQL